MMIQCLGTKLETEMYVNYDKYATEIHEWNKEVGWWDDPDECIHQKVMLMVTEVAEATEGERKDQMDDHLPSRKQAEVELADTLIRVLDIGGKFSIKYQEGAFPHPDAMHLEASIGRQHLSIVRSIIAFIDQAEFFGWTEVLASEYSILIKTIEVIAERNGYNLEMAMIEKIAYNRIRLDHTRRHRTEHFDGKKF